MKWILTLCTSLTVIFGSAQSAEDLKRLAEFKRMIAQPVALSLKEEVTIKVTKEIVYNPAKDTSQKLDVYQPVSLGKRKLPLVVFVHGKTPIKTNPKNWEGFKSWGALTASKGYIAITFTQSLGTPGRSINEAGADLQDALTYIKANHLLYNIDTTRIALLAYSAGVSLLSGAFQHDQSNIRCLAAFYGFMDIKNIDLFKQESEATLAKFSLINYLGKDRAYIPVFIARAGKEHNKGLNETIDSFLLKANNSNINLTLINHPEGVHGFDTQNNDERSREIIESMFTFLQYHLR